MLGRIGRGNCGRWGDIRMDTKAGFEREAVRIGPSIVSTENVKT